jgi:TolB-like protein
MNLWEELKRRNVFRVGAAYLAAAWLLLQVADMVLANFDAAPWMIQAAIFAAALAFPFVLILAWLYELTPDGIRAESEVEANGVIGFTGRKIDFVIIGVLVLAVGFLLARDYLLDDANELAGGNPSIAVLPFVNLSSDPEQEYFSDGISEEVLNLLAKVPNFKVISRTSAFSFKGDSVDIPTVAEQLDVDHVLEGSVRRAGDEVRVSVQLVEARSDTQLWSATYERTLDDIFAVQEEIAANVLAQLQVTLLGAAPDVPETEGEAYALFLQGRHIINQGLADAFPQAEVLLEQALDIDPNYIPALSELARLYVNQIPRGHKTEEEGFGLARELIDRIEQIAPNHGAIHGWRGWLAQRADNDMVTAAYHLEIAMALEPTNLDMLRGAIEIVKWLGYPEESVAMGEYLISRDPTCLSCYRSLAESYRDTLNLDEVEATINVAKSLRPGTAIHYQILGEALLLKGAPEAALAEFLQMPEDDPSRHAGISLALHDLGRQTESEETFLWLLENQGTRGPLAVAKVYAYMGQADLAFEWLERALEIENARLLTAAGYNPIYANLHGDARWQGYLEKRGISSAQLAELDFDVTLPQ